MSQLTIIATITAKAGHEAKVRQALLDLIPPTAKEPGFIQYDLHESLDDPLVFVFYENSENQGVARSPSGHRRDDCPQQEDSAVD